METNHREWPVSPELRDVRREVIRDEAARLFVANGYRSTTLDEVAASLGVTKGAIYHYFKSKDDILHAIVLIAMEAMEDNMRTAIASGGDAVSILYQILYGHVLTVIANRNSLGVFLRERREMAEAHRATIDDRMRQYTNAVVEIVRLAQQKGEHPEVDPQVAVFSWFASCNSVIQWYRPEGPLPPGAVATMLAAMAVQSIGLDPVRESSGSGGSR